MALRCRDRHSARSTFALIVDSRPAEQAAGRAALLTEAMLLTERPMPHMENDRIVESTTEARAGVTGHNVRYVLLIGTLAVIVLFAIAYVVTRT